MSAIIATYLVVYIVLYSCVGLLVWTVRALRLLWRIVTTSGQ